MTQKKSSNKYFSFFFVGLLFFSFEVFPIGDDEKKPEKDARSITRTTIPSFDSRNLKKENGNESEEDEIASLWDLKILENPFIASEKKIFKRRVFFDLDSTITWRISTGTNKMLPDGVFSVSVAYQDEPFYHVFLPYLIHVFQYLIDHDVEIHFFSAGNSERNVPLLAKYIDYLFGKEKEEILIKKGHFNVYSLHHMRNGQKNLLALLDGEHEMEETILIDDRIEYAPFSQHPVLTAGVTNDNVFDLFYRNGLSFSKDAFALNLSFYYLGILMTCFEKIEQEKRLSLRGALAHVLGSSVYGHQNQYYYNPGIYDLRTHGFMKKGLFFIRQKIPFAHFLSESLLPRDLLG